MKLSPHQVRAVLGINEQTLRYWKRAYPGLAQYRGYGPCYSFSDTLVLLITKQLVEHLGVEVSKLAPISDALLSACRESVRVLSESDDMLWIDLGAMTLSRRQDEPQGVAIAIPVHRLALELRARVLSMLGAEEGVQMPLALAPTFVPHVRRSTGG